MELISGKTYFIKKNLKFCNLFSRSGSVKFGDIEELGLFIFVGSIYTTVGDRNIFWSNKKGYLMMSEDTHTYVIDIEKEIADIKGQMDILQERLNKLEVR